MDVVNAFFSEITASATSSEATRLRGLSRAVECSDWLTETLGEDAPGDDGYALSRLLVKQSLDSYCPAVPKSTSTTISPPPSDTNQPHHPAVIATWVSGAMAILWATLNVLDALLGEIKAIRKAAAGVGRKGCWGKFLSVLARILRQLIFS